MAYPFRAASGGVGGEHFSAPHSRLPWQTRKFSHRLFSSGSSNHSTHSTTPSKVLLEPLEPRYLLSADLMPFSVDMSIDGDDLTLRLDDVRDYLQILNNKSGGAVIAEKARSDATSVRVQGSNNNDRFVVDYGIHFSLPFGISFDAGLGSDQLAIVNGLFDSVSYGASSLGAGVVDLFDGLSSDAINFTGAEDIDDSSSAANRTFSNDSGASKTLRLTDADALSDGKSTIDGGDFTPVSFNNPTDSLMLAAGDSGDTIILEDFDLGLSAPVHVVGGLGDDTVVGADSENTWTIDAADSGAVAGAVSATFADVENLTGGTGTDTFTVTATGALTGTIDGGGGSDTLAAPDTDNDWEITGTDAGTLNALAFINIENLQGGAGADTFSFLGGSISGTIDGGGGVNTLDYSAATGAVELNLAESSATDASRFANITEVAGGTGNDTLIGPNLATDWAITGTNTGTAAGITYRDVENLQGGSEDDTFIHEVAGDLTGLISGGLGSDTLIAADKSNTFNVTGPNAGNLNAQAFLDIENLEGGDLDDAFLFAAGGLLSGAFAGGLGNDRARGGDQRNNWRINSGNAGKLNNGDFSGVESLTGGTDEDTLIGPPTDTTWTVSGANAGDVAGVSFSGIENLEGEADNEDMFVFQEGGSLAGTINGGDAGFDTLVIDYDVIESAAYDATGPNSGTVTVDGTVIAFVGLEPVTFGGVDPKTVVDNLVVTATANADDLTLRIVSGDATRLELINNATSTIETANFKIPTNSLQINLGENDDRLVIGDVGAFDLSKLTVKGGDDASDIGTADKIVVTRNLDMTLRDAGLTVDDKQITLDGIEVAELTGGDTDNIFTITGWTGSGTLTGGDTSTGDTVVLEKDANFSLSNASLSATGGPTMALSGVDVANLTGGPSANVFAVSNWGGRATLEGLGEADTYNFGNDWGTVTINDDGGSLGFSAVTGLLSVRQSDGNTIIEDGSGNTLTFNSAGAFNTDLAAFDPVDGNKNLDTGLLGLKDVVDALDETGLLGQTLAFLGDPAGIDLNLSIGGLLDLADILNDTLVAPVAAESADSTLDDLVSALDVTDTDASDSQTSDVQVTGTLLDGGGLTLNVNLDASRDTTVDLNIFGGELQELLALPDGATLTGVLTIRVQWQFEVGVDAAGAFVGNFSLSDMVVTASITETLDFDARAGFLGVNAMGPLALNLAVTVDTDSLDVAAVSSADSLTQTKSATALTINPLTVTPLAGITGVATGALNYSDADVFDEPSVPLINRSNFQDIESFYNTDAGTVQTLLASDFLSFLKVFGPTALAVPVPLTGALLSDVFDLAQLFDEEFLADLELSPNPLSTNLADLNDGDGIDFVAGVDFVITLRDGTTIDVEISHTSPPATLSDLMTAINAERTRSGVTDGQFLAQADPADGSLILVDKTVPPPGVAGKLTVSLPNGADNDSNPAAFQLGLLRASEDRDLGGVPVQVIEVAPNDGPNFETIQQMAASAPLVVSGVTYDSGTQFLDFLVNIDETLSTAQFQLAFPAFGPLTGLTSADLLDVTSPQITMSFPFQLDLSTVGFPLLPTTPVTALNGGDGVRTVGPISGTAEGVGLDDPATPLDESTVTLVDLEGSFGGTNALIGRTIAITDGTGKGQTRTIVGNTLDTITVNSAWTTAPGADSDYQVTAQDMQIQLRDGRTFAVNLDHDPGTATVAELVALIEDAAEAVSIATPVSLGVAGAWNFDVQITPDGLVLVDRTTAGLAITGTAKQAVVVDPSTDSDTSDNATLTDTDASFISGALVGRSVNLLDSTGKVVQSRRIIGNDATTLFLEAAWDADVADGTHYEIPTTFDVIALQGSKAVADLNLAGPGAELEVRTDTGINVADGVPVALSGDLNPDITVTLGGGAGSFSVDLDGVATVQDVVNRIRSAADAAPSVAPNAFEVLVSDSGTVFLIDRQEAGDIGSFTVTGTAAADLFAEPAQLIDADLANDGRKERVIVLAAPASAISGGPLHGDTPVKHLYLADNALSAPHLSTSLSVGGPGAAGSGLWGRLGVDFSDAVTTITPFTVDVTIDPFDPEPAPDGTPLPLPVSLSALKKLLPEPTSLIAGRGAAVGGGQVQLDLDLVPDPAVSITNSLGAGPAEVQIILNYANDTSSGNNQVSVTSTAPAFVNASPNDIQILLEAVEQLTIDDVLSSLRRAKDYLLELQTQSKLAERLPGLSASIGKLFGFGDKFGVQLAELALANPQTLQRLVDQLDTLLDNVIPLTAALSFDATAEDLKFDLHFDLDSIINRQLPLTLDLTKLGEDLVALGLQKVAAIVDTVGASPLDLTADGTIDLELGIGLSDPVAPSPFLFGDMIQGTGTEASFDIRAVNDDGLNFTALFGSLPVEITGGSFVLDEDGDGTGTGPAIYTVELKSDAPVATPAEIATAAADPQTKVVVGSQMDATFDLAFPEQVVPADAPASVVPNITVQVTNLNDPADGTSVLTTNLVGGLGNWPTFEVLTQNFSLADSMNGFKLGFYDLFSKLDEALDTALFGMELPLVSKQLTEAADFLLQIRDSVFDNLNLLSNVLTPELIHQSLFDAFGPGGYGWLQNDAASGDSIININDIELVTETVSPSDGRELVVGVEYRMDLVMPPQLLDFPVNLDLLLPGLGLEIDALAQVLFGFSLPLSVGISIADGVYIDVSQLNELEISLDVALPNATVLMSDNPNLTFSNTGSPSPTITRDRGSWGLDGFQAGHIIDVADSDSSTDINDGEYVITGIDPTGKVLTLSSTFLDGASVTAQGPQEGFTVEVNEVSMTGGPNLTFTDVVRTATVPRPGDTITRDTGSWVKDGFRVGDSINIIGTTLNNGTHTIAAIDPTGKVLTVEEVLTNENNVSGVVVRSGEARGFSARMGVLPYRVWDATPGQSELTGTLLIDLLDPNAIGFKSRLSVSELMASDTDQDAPAAGFTIAPLSSLLTITEDANDPLTLNDIVLDIETDLPPGAAFPPFRMELDVSGWDFSIVNSLLKEVPDGSAPPAINFNNVQFELVGFMRDFVGPALQRLDVAFDALNPLTTFLENEAFPILSLLFGRASYVSAAGTFGGQAEIGDYLGASIAIKRLVSGGNPFERDAITEFFTDILDSNPLDDAFLPPIASLVGQSWIDMGAFSVDFDDARDGDQTEPLLAIPKTANDGKTPVRVFGGIDDAPLALTGGDPELEFDAATNRIYRANVQVSNVLLSFQPTFVGIPVPVSLTGDGDIKRSSGSWVTDKFVKGMFVSFAGSGDNNGHTYVVERVTHSTLSVSAIDIFTPLLKQDPTIFTVVGNIQTWQSDGFKMGQTISIEGTTDNDGDATVMDVTDTYIEISTPVGLVGETVNGVVIKATNSDGTQGSIFGQIFALALDPTQAGLATEAAKAFVATQLLPGRAAIDGILSGLGLSFTQGIDPINFPFLKDIRNGFGLLLGDTTFYGAELKRTGTHSDSILVPAPEFSFIPFSFDLVEVQLPQEDSMLLTYGTPELFVLLYQDFPLSKERFFCEVPGISFVCDAIPLKDIAPTPFISINFEARADFEIAWDTTGLDLFGKTRNPHDLVEGFYFDDTEGIEPNPSLLGNLERGGNDQTGFNGFSFTTGLGAKSFGDAQTLVKDEPQARILGGIGIGVFLGFSKFGLSFKLGTEVVFLVGWDYNLHDVVRDGRVRASEFDILTGFGTPSGPVALDAYDQGFRFEVRWDVFAKLKLLFTIFDIRINIITVGRTFPVDIPTFIEPNLGTLNTGELTLGFLDGQDNVLYVGANSEFNADTLRQDIVVSGQRYHKVFTNVLSITGTGSTGSDTVIVSDEVLLAVTLDGGAGKDNLVGGGGDDFLYGGGDDDRIEGGAGNDKIWGDDLAGLLLGADLIFGRIGNDIIRAGKGRDVIRGGRGRDDIDGGEGNDAIDGGAGDDTVDGGDNDDIILGGIGKDTLRGGLGRDTIEGGKGADLIFGENNETDTGIDPLNADRIFGGLGSDVVDGGAGPDIIFGGQHNDSLQGGDGNDILDGGGASDRVRGGNDDDLIKSLAGNDILNGQAGDDTYQVFFEGGKAESLIQIVESGPAEDTDVFVAFGTLLDDQFLLRASVDGSNAFVAMLNDPDHDISDPGYDPAVERINYLGLERIVVNADLGDDRFAVDDTAAEITLNGQGGDDFFQIGQLFRSERNEQEANVAVGDVFATIETTRGFLSNGISKAMTVNGGLGQDNFVVFHNRAVLSLNGDEGDDSFEVRAFALAGSQEPQRERTDITGGAGADLVQYAVNAPVNINGGDGFDTLTVIGTEFGDDFVITDKGVFGAGLTINFTNIESLRVDGAEGNDRFFVQSTSEKFVTEIFGGLGEDTFNMSGDTPPVVSNDLLGHSGIIANDVSFSDDLRYQDLTIYGVSANVADNDEPAVVIRESGGSTIVTEGSTLIDSYEVVLTRTPRRGFDVLVKALAPLPTPDQRELGALAYRLSSSAPGAGEKEDGSVVTLRFTADNWYIPQTIEISADGATTRTDTGELFTRPELGQDQFFVYDDAAFEGVRSTIINHLVVSAAATVEGNPLSVAASPTITIKTDRPFYEFLGEDIRITLLDGTIQDRRIVDARLVEGNMQLSVDRSWLTGSSLPNSVNINSIIIDGIEFLNDPGDFVTAANPTLTIANPLDPANPFIDSVDDLLGRQVAIVDGLGTGQSRFIIAADAVIHLEGSTVNLFTDPADPKQFSFDRVLNIDGNPVTATSGAILKITAQGDLNNSGETLDVNVEGVVSQILFGGGSGRFYTPLTAEIELTKDQLQTILNDGEINLTFTPSAGTRLFDLVNVDNYDLLVLLFLGRAGASLSWELEFTADPADIDDKAVVSGLQLTLDRGWLSSDVPDRDSTYQISIDDAIIGKVTAINETPAGLPPDPSFPPTLDQRSTFSDSTANFSEPDYGPEGLRGAVLQIVGGPGAGQQRLILGTLPGDPHTLILNGGWRTDPVSGESLYRIARYDGLAIPSVSVEVNDNDEAGLIVDETKGFDSTAAGLVVADYDTITTVIEGGDGDHLGERDVLRVRLSRMPNTLTGTAEAGAADNELIDTGAFTAFDPNALVGLTVNLLDATGDVVESLKIAANTDDKLTLEDDWNTPPSAGDNYKIPTTVTVALGFDGTQLDLQNLDGSAIQGNVLVFNPTNWNVFQQVVVVGEEDLRREGFHTSLIEFVTTSADIDQPASETDNFDIPVAEPVEFVGLSRQPTSITSVTYNNQTLDEYDPVLAPDGGTDAKPVWELVSNKILFRADGDFTTVVGNQLDIEYQYTNPGFDDAFTQPVLVRVNDVDAPTVLVRETGGSTDVVEGAASFLTIQLDGAQNFAVNSLVDRTITVVRGKGEGQSATIVGNTSDTITIDDVWSVIPDGTTTFNLDAPATGVGISAPGEIVGNLSARGERDRYEVFLLKDAEYTFNLEGVWTGGGSLYDPYLRLFDSANVQRAFNDDGGFFFNSRLTFKPTVTGTYFLSAGAYADRYTGTYTLSTSVSGDIAATTATAASLFLPGAATSVVDSSGDQDWYRVELALGNTYTFDLTGISNPDPLLRLLDSDGIELETDDDGGIGLNSRLIFTPNEIGTYFLSAQAFSNNTGSYTLSGTATTAVLQAESAAVTTFEIDTYELVLTAPPDDGTGSGKVQVTVTPEITKTTRTGGVRTDAVQVEIFNIDGLPAQRVDRDGVSGSVDTVTYDTTNNTTAVGITLSDEQRLKLDIADADDLVGLTIEVTNDLGVKIGEAEITAAEDGTGGETTLTVAGDFTGLAISGYFIANGNLVVTFDETNWDDPVRIGVRAIDDQKVDGGDTKVFADGPNTLSRILGPVVVDGAGGEGSLSLPPPVMLPGEINRRPSDGNVVDFTANTTDGPGAVELMTVETQDLEDRRVELKLDSIDDLEGLTLEMTLGQGVDVILNPDRPSQKFDRFWLIKEVNELNDVQTQLTLQNPSQVDPSKLDDTDVPNAASEYAITTLSANFFVNEPDLVDVMFVHDDDSPADSTGFLTASRLWGLNMGPDITIGDRLRAGGITYGNLEVLQIDLGSGNNDFHVLGTHTRPDDTQTQENEFFQTWTFLNAGDDIFWPFPEPRQGDIVTVSLDAADVPDVVSGTASGGANATETQFASLTDAPFKFGANDSLAGYTVTTTNSVGTVQVRTILGNTDDQLFIDGVWSDVPDSSTTYTITNPGDGDLAVNAQDGDDTVDASLSSLGIVVFGGLGNDNITGGSGEDIIFGDRGRVDYLGEPTNGTATRPIVTRLGTAPEPILGTVAARMADDPLNILKSVESLPYPNENNDNDIGLVGLYVDVNDGFGFLQTSRLISNNTSTSMTLATPFDDTIDLPGADPNDPSKYRISTYPEDQTDGKDYRPSVIVSVDPELGGNDTIYSGDASDIVIGGAGADDIDVTVADDAVVDDEVVLGDSGQVLAAIDNTGDNGIGGDYLVTLGRVMTTAAALGANDRIVTGDGKDIILAGTSGPDLAVVTASAEYDVVNAGNGNDIVVGDSGYVAFTNALHDDLFTDPTTGEVVITVESDPTDLLSSDVFTYRYTPDSDPTNINQIEVTAPNAGGDDVIRGEGGEDVLIGGAMNDGIDGGSERDLIFGDNVELQRRPGNITNPRFQTLLGQVIYSRTDLSAVEMGAPTPFALTSGQPLNDGNARDIRNQGTSPMAAWYEYEVIKLYHSKAIEDGDVAGMNTSFGDDYIAGGADHDVIFGQLGNDVIQGDGDIESAIIDDPNPVGAVRVVNDDDAEIELAPGFVAEKQNLLINSSFDSATDGDDYIEGNGGNDVIFGNLGQDDIVGGSSSLFTLNSPELRPDGNDTIFGGSGTQIGRNDEGLPNDGTDISDRHGRDADAITGDNANIYRLVGTGGSDTGGFVSFTYDSYGALKIIPRAVELLDYTPGGPDFTPVIEVDPVDIAINPTTGMRDIGASDEIHGESGDDFIYGMVGKDVLFGDGDDDNLIGGYDADWISGGAGQDGVIGDDGRIITSRNGLTEPLNGVFTAVMPDSINSPGNIQQAEINSPDQLKKAVDLTPFNLDPNTDLQDTLFPPEFADDIIYGGLGRDFLHGAAGDDAISGAEALAEFFAAPINPGDALRFGDHTRAGEFFDYNEFEPLVKLDPFFLNFEAFADEARTIPVADGDDVLFGALGNDWLVGGTGRDNMYGGWGNDLLDADDDKDTSGGLNDEPDGPNATYEDRGYGGAGRDVLYANTGGDRLIDWAGEFNSYLVPFAPFGLATVSRAPQPGLADFLYDLSASDGADPTRATDTFENANRNGEPFGELGVVRQSDDAWQDQTGAPIDPQPGNISGGARDVLRGADFNSGSASGFFADSGSWEISSGKLNVAAESLGGDAVSVYHVDKMLPIYFEVEATISTQKALGGWKANAYVIFDYQSPSDFKFAGLDDSRNKMQMGHRTNNEWVIDVETNYNIKPNRNYDVLVAVNGTAVTLLVNGSELFQHTFAARTDSDGYAYGINAGMVGFGSDNSRGSLDNVRVQILPPDITWDRRAVFGDAVDDVVLADTSGEWTQSSGRITGAPDAGSDRAVNLVDLGIGRGLSADSILILNAIVNSSAGGGLVFDYYGSDDFKFAEIDTATNKLIIGHYTPNGGRVIDNAVDEPLDAGKDYELELSLKGTTVSVSVKKPNAQKLEAIVSHVFNAVTVDGGFGLLARDGSAAFDDLRVRTNDTVFLTDNEPLVATTTGIGGEAISRESLGAILAEAKRRLLAGLPVSASSQLALNRISVDVADLGGLALGRIDGDTITLDDDAAGHGWFVDSTPEDDSEFKAKSGDVLGAKPNGDAFGRMDLLSALVHEMGHAVGLTHDSALPFMASDLEISMRVAPDSGHAAKPTKSSAKVFDESRDAFVSLEEAELLRRIGVSDRGSFNNHNDADDPLVLGLGSKNDNKSSVALDSAQAISAAPKSPATAAGEQEGAETAQSGTGFASQIISWTSKFTSFLSSGLGS